jgi:hypothetical protein
MTTTHDTQERLSLLADAFAAVRLHWPGTVAEQSLVSGILAREARNLAAYLGHDSADQWVSIAQYYGAWETIREHGEEKAS